MPWEKTFDVDEVLDKAMHRFWRHGYRGSSVQDLVDCTGIHRGSLYGTYGDKRALFLAALAHYDQEHRQRFLSELESQHEPKEAIRRAFQTFADSADADGEALGCLMTNTALEVGGHDEEVRRIVAGAQKAIESFFRRMVVEGQRRGQIPDHLDPRSAARGLLSSFLGLIVLTRSRPEKALLRGAVEEAMRRIS